jgi:hypothetical protein
MKAKATLILTPASEPGTIKAGRTVSAEVHNNGDHMAFDVAKNDLSENDTFLYKSKKFVVKKILTLLHRRIRAIAVPE